MIPETPPSTERSLARQIFFSPDEPRLRSGWRLLLHAILTLLLVLVFSTIVSVVGSLLGILDFSGANPASLDSPLMLLGALAGITIATWLARRYLDRRSFLSLGLTYNEDTWPDLLFGTLMPAGLFGLIFLFQWAVGWLEIEATAFRSLPTIGVMGRVLQGLILFIIVGYQEELLSRGYQLQNLAEGLGLPLAVFVSSAIFALLHAANPSASVLSTVGILVAGFFLALGWLRTGQLWLPIGLHIGWNFFQGTIFGFPVSGTGGFHLIEHTVSGPALVTGGAFGPEAGVLGLAANLLGAYALWRYTEGRGGPLKEWTDLMAGDTPERPRIQP